MMRKTVQQPKASKSQVVVAAVRALNGDLSALVTLARNSKLPRRLVACGVIVLMLFAATTIGFFAGGSVQQDIQDGQKPAQNCVQQVVVTGAIPQNVPAIYRGIFTQAAAASGVDANLLTTIFWVENGRHYPDPPPPYGHGKPWPVSGPGAAGAFQFMPGTWPQYATDGNHDGVKDVNDLTDAAYSAAGMLSDLGGKIGTPLGSVNAPHTKHTMVNVMASYNNGPGGSFTSKETVNYIHYGATYYNQLAHGAMSNATATTTAITCTPVKATDAACATGAAPGVYVIGGDLAAAASYGGLGKTLLERGIQLKSAITAKMSLVQASHKLKSQTGDISSAETIVVMLGDTKADGSGKAYVAHVRGFIKALRHVNSVARVWWVTPTADDTAATNKTSVTLEHLVVAANYRIIDWHSLSAANIGNGSETWTSAKGNLTVTGRTRVADLVSQTVQQPLVGGKTVCAGATAKAQAAINFAKKRLGTPYLWGGTGTAAQNGRFDCSGLTQAAYKSVGISLARTAQAQFNQAASKRQLIDKISQLRPGDLVFFGTRDGIHHVGIFTQRDAGGNYWMVDAPHTGTSIRNEVFAGANGLSGWRDYFGAAHVL